MCTPTFLLRFNSRHIACVSIYQNDVKVDLCVMKKETKLLYDMCDVGDGER